VDLVVDAEKRLPAICLKCGARKHIVRRNERLTAATSTQGLGAVGGVCGFMVARAMRDDPVVGALILGGTLAGSIVVSYIIHSRAPHVELALPLCATCNATWRVGLWVRRAVLGMVGAACVALGVGFFAHETAAYITGAVLLAGMIVVALAFRLRDRFVHAATIQGSRVVLRGVSADAGKSIAARLRLAERGSHCVAERGSHCVAERDDGLA